MNQPQAWQFGAFKLLPAQRLLLEGNAPVRVGGRALDLLIVLVEAAGKIVGRDELIASVWKKVVVDEGSLRVHVAALRRALRDDGDLRRYIVNVAGRGYCFVEDVSPSTPDGVNETMSMPHEGRSHLPSLLVNVVGREEAISEVCGMVIKNRMVAVVGAGGVGKTTVAIAAAAQLTANYRDGVRFVDLAPLSDAQQVANVWAHAVDPTRPVLHEGELGELLADRHMLIVLDNCEHVVQAAAAAAEAVLIAAPGVHVLATSREPTRAMGEWVIRLASLELPPASGRLTVEQAEEFSAVQLFTQRIAANFAGFLFRDDDVPHAIEICRRLDGIPLAIELAAGRVAQLGLPGLAARLEDRFAILTKGRRTALPRQQTLRAAIDWSYEQLSEDQKAVLRRLSVFAGAFSFDSAVAVCEDDLTTDYFDAIDELVLKSLITVDTGTDVGRYRLLETTRAYAHEKLKEAGELLAASRAHALHVCIVFERVESASPFDGAVGDAGDARWIDDIKLAVQMSFSTLRDPRMSMRLLSATASVWFQRSLLDEYRERAELALEKAGDLAEQPEEALMRMWNLLGLCYWHIKGTGPEVARAFGRAYDLARRLRNVHFERMALWGLCAQSCSTGDYAAALALAHQHANLTPLGTDPQAEIQSGNVMQVSLHFMGDLAASRGEAMATIGLIRRIDLHGNFGQFRLDPHSVINAFLSHTLWIQGLPTQALEVAAEAVQSARSTRHALSLCFALFGHCAVLLWCGRWVELGRQADSLMEVATDRRLGFWKAWAQTYKDALAYGTEGVVVPHSPGVLRVPHQFEMLTTVSDELLSGEVLLRAEAGHCPWCAPEVLRAQGERLLRQGSAPQEAEQWFIRALDLARASRALSWELRAATSLAQCWLNQNQRDDASALLAGVLERYTEGFDTPDVQRALQMLQG
ncbi:ATP-binding protein [Paucibacter sp. M5-1]|uniref:ATP-binding protein n=1 Tax=Paucibacter sp. M5-1 TaxID=3015998 RepID=UPI0022B9216C|nr:winged helix-turn-helix domain-containing protein [Paucibacter sp. M5-1]MCZ7884114.1 winged helix-turn-helix domain-containing protein [Paucibacter sp. M5-1]